MQDLVFLVLLGIVAFLYSSVGHGGASGYLALMALFSFQPSLMKSSALILNIFVSITSFIQFYRAGHFRWKLFYPLALASVPMAFLGGTMVISDSLYKKMLAICLVLAIFRMLMKPQNDDTQKEASFMGSLAIGGIIGLLSGMLGIGGGIILSPILILLNWANLKQTAAISALFIFVNSMAGFAGLLSKGFQPNTQIYTWLTVAFVAGLCGSYFGSRKFNVPTLRYTLAGGLIIACLKLIFT
jgi:uncharacterized membrane protein YfcA